jgi:hypothetical protein
LRDGGDFPDPDFFSNGKSQWTRPTTPGPLAALVHSEPWPWPAEELTGAWPSGRSRARWFTGDGAMERGEHGKSVSVLTGRRWRSSSGEGTHQQ